MDHMCFVWCHYTITNLALAAFKMSARIRLQLKIVKHIHTYIHNVHGGVTILARQISRPKINYPRFKYILNTSVFRKYLQNECVNLFFKFKLRYLAVKWLKLGKFKLGLKLV